MHTSHPFLISWFLSPHKCLFFLDSLYLTRLAMPPVWFTDTLVAATRLVTSDGGYLFFVTYVSVLVIGMSIFGFCFPSSFSIVTFWICFSGSVLESWCLWFWFSGFRGFGFRMFIFKFSWWVMPKVVLPPFRWLTGALEATFSFLNSSLRRNDKFSYSDHFFPFFAPPFVGDRTKKGVHPSPQFIGSSSIVKNTINNDGFKTCKDPRNHQFITLDPSLIFGGRRGDNDMIESPRSSISIWISLHHLV